MSPFQDDSDLLNTWNPKGPSLARLPVAIIVHLSSSQVTYGGISSTKNGDV